MWGSEVSISVVKCSVVKCGEVLQCSDVLLFLSFFIVICMFCVLLFPPVSYVFLLSCLCTIVMHVLLCTFCLHSGYPDWGFSPCFSLSCKANARIYLAKTGDGPHCSKLVVICVVLLLFVLFCCYLCCSMYCFFRLCCSMYCLFVNVYCTTATGCLPNCS